MAYIVSSPQGFYRVDTDKRDKGDYDEDYTDTQHSLAWEDTDVDSREDIQLRDFRRKKGGSHE